MALDTITNNCLNCGRAVSYNFCEFCGQKTVTERFTLKHVFSQDFIRGIYNLDEGLLLTLKEVFTRPGHAIREYVQGKRVNHFNYFAFFVLAITVSHFVQEYAKVNVESLFATNIQKSLLSFNEYVFHKYDKLFSFVSIPVFALISYFVFKKAAQNYAEHFVLNTYKAAGSILILSLFYFVGIGVANHTFLKVLYVVTSCLQIAYEFIFYYQFFSAFGYSKRGLAFRSLIVSLFTVVLFIRKWVIIY